MKTISMMEGWKPEIMEKCPVFFRRVITEETAKMYIRRYTQAANF